MTSTPIRIDYFSDVLCVWAYTAQIRLDELEAHFGHRIELQHHFIPVFGCVNRLIDEYWSKRGGYAGYSEHVRKICTDFPHVELHPDIWTRDIPASSANAHLFLKAVDRLERTGTIAPETKALLNGNTLLEAVAWALRLAFFRDLRDIAQRSVQLEIASTFFLPLAPLQEMLDNGVAMADLCADVDLRDRYHVEGSPTYVLNEGRQKLYGNVGYKIIEANIEELLHRPSGQASWC